MLEQAEQGLTDECREPPRPRAAPPLYPSAATQAFFDETRFTGLDLPTDVQATRAAARAALAVFADPGPDDRLDLRTAAADASRPASRPRSSTAATSSSWSWPRPSPRHCPARTPSFRPSAVCTSSIRPPDCGQHPRRPCTRERADCLARKGDKAGAARERAAAERLRPTTVLDHFLAGYEAYRRQDWKTALEEFETVAADAARPFLGALPVGRSRRSRPISPAWPSSA